MLSKTARAQVGWEGMGIALNCLFRVGGEGEKDSKHSLTFRVLRERLRDVISSLHLPSEL